MLTLLAFAAAADGEYVEPGVEYRTGGSEFGKAWQAFYVEADHEPDLDDPLIEAGSSMALAICEAVAHKDMKRRRYAIGALGFIGERRALPCLEAILRNREEKYYFRGDALHSIYQIDHDLGSRYAAEVKNEHEYLARLAKDIANRAPWLTEPTRE